MFCGPSSLNHELWRHASLRASDGGILAAISGSGTEIEAKRGRDAAFTGRLGSPPPPPRFMVRDAGKKTNFVPDVSLFIP
jgi:hypothetical protein